MPKAYAEVPRSVSDPHKLAAYAELALPAVMPFGARDSAAYAEALKALGDGAVRDFRIVEGVE